jgi:Kinesin motor domain
MEGNGVFDNSTDGCSQGLMQLAFKDIFDRIATNTDATSKYLVRASYLEIYNEDVRDLLSKDPSSTNLDVREVSDTGEVYVKDLSSVVVKSFQEIASVFQVGKRNRMTAATLMNNSSSRSHSIFTVTVESSSLQMNGKSSIRVGKLHLVDLAGSERQSKTGAVGIRLKEATKINLSLSALGNVISALVDKKSTHIPYRDSKLTRLLQDSLGGNAKTLMIATCGPADYNIDETISTLKYAHRAKEIQNKPRINEDPKDALLRQFQDEIARLKAKLGSGDEILDLEHGKNRAVVELERQRQEIIEKSNLERQNVEQLIEQSAEERRSLEEEIAKKEEIAISAIREKEMLLKQITEMQEKLITGGHVAIEAAKKQEEQFGAMIAELQSVNKKLGKTHAKLRSVQQEAMEAQSEFRREKSELSELCRTLSQQAKLQEAIISKFIPQSVVNKLKSTATWSEEQEKWTMNLLSNVNSLSWRGRPSSSGGAKSGQLDRLSMRPRVS